MHIIEIMMKNLAGIGVSLVFVFSIIGAATFLRKKNILKEEGSRKFVHIGVGNWWFIALIFFDNLCFAVSIPALFVVLNYISYKSSLFEGMERKDRSGGLGTVYYAISLLILSAWSFSAGRSFLAGTAGIMIMTYGDGFAAVIGRHWGGRTGNLFGMRKSIAGTLAMFFISFAAVFIIFSAGLSSIDTGMVIILSLALGLAAAVIELLSPRGLDNLTVPLGSAILVMLIENGFAGV